MIRKKKLVFIAKKIRKLQRRERERNDGSGE